MKERILYYDCLRALAIVAVIAIHTNSIGYEFNDHSFNYVASAFIRQIINFGVPLFLAISGYFLATKKVDTKELYFAFLKKQIPRVLFPLIIWSLVYVAFDYSRGGNLSSLIKKAVTFQASAPFYYILLIIQFYVLLPVMQRIGRTKTGLLLSLLVTFIVVYVLRYLLNMHLPLIIYAGNFATWLVFFVLGIYLKINGIKIQRGWLVTLVILTFCLSLVETGLSHYYFNQPIVDSVTAVKFSSFLYSFFLILFLFSLKGTNNAFFAYLGELSFGTYFLHVLILTLSKLVVTSAMPGLLQFSLLAQLLIVAAILGICTGVGMLLRSINSKFSSKYLGF